MANSKKPDELLPTRASLLSRLKDYQDNASWQEFFDTYWRLIYGLAIREGLSDAEAQDAVQSTIISTAKHFIEKGFKYNPERSFKAWLLKNTSTKIIDIQRKRLRVASRSMAPHDDTRTGTIENVSDPRGFDPAVHWDAEWKQQMQERAIEALRSSEKPKHFQIFDAYVLKQWPVQLVMKTLGVSQDVVYQTKRRMTVKLQKEIARLEREVPRNLATASRASRP